MKKQRYITRFGILVSFTILIVHVGTPVAKPSDCTNFRIGKFELNSPEINGTFIIHRDEKFQTEINAGTGERSRYKINWITDCEYELVIVEGQPRFLDYYKDKILVTRILEANASNCKFECWLKGTKVKYHQVLTKIEGNPEIGEPDIFKDIYTFLSGQRR